jgi:hypothetical protein
MLQIYIYGPTENGFLDLDPNTSLDLESTADLFDEDLSAGEFSLPVDIPWTEKNRRLTGFAERFHNFRLPSGGVGGGLKCVVYDSGFPELTSAKFSMIGKEGNFSGTKGKFSATVTGTKGLFGSQIKNKKLSDLNLGGKITFATDSRTFAQTIMKGGLQQYNFLTFVPVAIENFFDTGRPDYDSEFLAKDTVNTVVITGAGADGWTFGRPTAIDPAVAAAPGTAEYADYRTVPFIKTKYLLKRIFEEHGYKVTGDIFDSPDYDDLATFNNYAIENYSPDHIDYNRTIFVNNHVPNILIIDYLKGLLGAFSLYPLFTGDNEVKLVFRKNLKKEKKIFSLNGLCSELFSSTTEDQNANDGYKLTYNWNGDDYYSDRVKDLKDKTIVATVATVADLATVNPGRAMTTDDIAFVLADNMYYQVADGTSAPVKWDAYAENLADFVVGAGDRTVDIPISTLCTYVELQEASGLYVKRDYVGARMTGSYLNNKGVLVKSDCPNKIFFAKRRYNSSNVLVPFSYNHNRDSSNRMITPFSLAWKTDSGMAIVFHKDWQDIRQNLELVKTTITANRRILRGIADSNYLEIKGCLFMLSKADKTIPLKSVIDVELAVV